MNRVQTMVEALRIRSEEQGEALAYRCLLGPEQRPNELSYAELDRRAQRMAHRLRSLGLAGQRVLLPALAQPEFLVAFYACLLAKVVPAMAFTPKKHRRNALAGIIKVAQPAAVLASASALFQFADRAALLGLGPGVLYEDWSASSELPDSLEPLPTVYPEDLAFLQFSSGSTGDPKGVEVRHQNLVANLARQEQALGHPAGAAVVSWLPLHHDMGLVGQMLWGLYVGAPVTLLSPMHFFERPLRWLEAIERYRAYTAGGPNFAYQACLSSIDAKTASSLDLSSWKVAFNGAEPVQMETIRRFAEHFSAAGFKEQDFVPSYGLAESCVFVSAKRGGPTEIILDKSSLAQGEIKSSEDPVSGQSVVSCGQGVLGDEISICDPETGAPLGSHRVGEIVVRGPSVCHGYWQHPEASARSFSLAPGGAGYRLHTGDLGFVAQGELYITGRIKDLIICRGQNIYPQDLEQALESGPWALRLGMKAAVGQLQGEGEFPWMVCELTRSAMSEEPDLKAWAREIRAEVGQATGVELGGVVLTRPASVPRTSSGKVQRQACARALAKEELRVLHQERFDASAGASFESALSGAQSFIESRLGPTALGGRSALELGLGSLDCALLAQALGEHWGRGVELAELMEAPDLQAWIQAQEVRGAPALATEQEGLAALPESASLYPLSAGQAALWAVQQSAPDPSVNNLHLVVELSGEIGASWLKDAFAQLRERHPVLRTLMVEQGQGVRAKVRPAHEGGLDWQQLPAGQSIEAILREPFDLSTQEPMRVRWVEHAQGSGATLVWVVHHIAVDFWSVVVLVRELRALLVGEQALSPAPRVDYAQWQAHQAALIAKRGPADWAYWSQMLGGELPPHALPLDRPRAGQPPLGAVYHLPIPASLVSGLDDLAQRCKLTRYRLYLALFALALARQGGQQDLVVGTPITGRDDARWQDVIGYFVNPAAIRMAVRPQQTLGEYLDQVSQRVKEALAHRTLPFAQIVERLAPERASGRWPLYQVAFTYQQAHEPSLAPLAAMALQDPKAKLDWGPIVLGHAQIEERVENFDLKLVMADRGDALLGAFQYDRSVLNEASVQRLAATWLELAQALLHADLQAPLRALHGVASPSASTEDSNETQEEPDSKGCSCCSHLMPGDHLAARWERLAKAGCGVVIQGRQRSYCAQDLDRWSTALVEQMRGRGVVRGQRVALELGMQPEFIAAALACARMGVTYVPVDPRYPAARRALIHSDAGVQGVWCESGAQGDFSSAGAPRWAVPACPETDNPASMPLVTPHRDEIAYLVYTSGSTGRPKGVEVSHGALLSLVDWHHQRYGTSPQTRMVPTASVGFDASVWELWPHLLAGSTLVMAPEGLVREPGPFLRWLAKERIDTLFLATALLETMLEHGDWPADLGVRHWLTGGDRLGAVQAAMGERGMVLHNHYGPTEAAVVATAGRVQPCASPASLPGSLPDIGQGLPGMTCEVLAEDLARCSVGAVGSLYLSGPQLAQGYAHNPRATALHFIPNPYGPAGSRMYDTGDRVRQEESGALSFVGRRDAQIQIRGQRVEPGEIQAFLSAQPEVQSAKVLVQKSEQGAYELAAYVVPHPVSQARSATLEAEQIQDWRALYDQRYAQLSPQGGQTKDDKDLVGWCDQVQRLPIPAEQMWRSVHDSVQAIAALKPQVLLEIGAGSGLLAKSLAPTVQRYWATDLSEQAVQHLCAWADSAQCEALQAFCAPAHQVLDHPDLEDELTRVDTVVLNSVLQCFPSSEYLQRLLRALFERLPGLAQVYIGDVRDAELLALFHQEKAWAQAGQRQSLHAVTQAAQRGLAMEGQLCVGSTWWNQAQDPWQGVARLHSGNDNHEISRYRYDVLLRRRSESSEASVARLDLAAHSDQTLEEILTGVQGPTCVVGLLDARLQKALARSNALEDLGEIERSYLRVQDAPVSTDATMAAERWQDPHTLYQCLEAKGLVGFLRPGPQRDRGAFELWVAPLGQQATLEALAAQTRTCESSLANEPWKTRVLSELPKRLLERSQASLPAHMVPRSLFAVPAWPSTVHGKLDRRALPQRSMNPKAGGASQATDPAQILLSGLYAEVLGLAQVDLDQNFFALGGDSILAIQIASKARAQGWALSSGQVLDHPSIRALATQISQTHDPNADLLAHAVHRAPLTPMQQGLWIEHNDAPQSYIETLMLRFEGALDPERLKLAWLWVMERHDALRCEFHWDSHGGSQRPVAMDLDAMDWVQLEESQIPEGPEPGFDLSRAPAMRWRLIERGQDQCQDRCQHRWELRWTHSHLLLDGWSVAAVVAELLQNYVALGQGRPLRLRPAPSFVAYAEQQARAPKRPPQSRFWRSFAPNWQASQGQSKLAPVNGGCTRVTLDLVAGQGDRIKAAAAKANTTVSTLITAAWGEIWKHMNGQDCAVLGIVDSGRDQAICGIESMVGLLIQSFPVVFAPDEPGMTWNELYCRRSKALREAKAAAQGQSRAELARWLGAQRGGELWDCLVAIENYPRSAGVGAVDNTLALASVEHRGSTHYPLTLVVVVHDGVSLQLEVDHAQIDPGHAQGWLQALAALLDVACWDAKAMVRPSLEQLEIKPLQPRPSGRAHPLLPDTGVTHPEPQTVASLWARVMNRAAVELDDDFFTMGGDSIVAMTLVQALRAQGWGCTVQTLMNARTPRELASKLTALDPVQALPHRGRGEQGPIALNPIQRWLLDQDLAAPHHFNQALRIPVPEGVSESQLAQALEGLAEHHAALRCNLVGDSPETWALEVQAKSKGRWPLHQLQLADPKTAAQVLTERCEALQAGFVLEQGPLFAALWVQGSAKGGCDELILMAHHLVVDAVSWRVLLADLQLRLDDPQAPLAPPTASLDQCARAYDRYTQGAAQAQKDHWERSVWSQDCPWLQSEKAGLVQERRYLLKTLDPECTQALLSSGTQNYRAKFQELLLASFVQSLAAGPMAAGQEIVVDVEGHGRYENELGICVDRCIGWFTTQLPCALRVESSSAGSSWQGQVEQVKRAVRAVSDQGLGYGLLRMNRSIPASQARVSWNYLGQVDARFAAASSMLGAPAELEAQMGGCHGPKNRCAYVVDLNLSLLDNQLLIHVGYGPSLCASTMQQWLDTWIEQLAELAQQAPSQAAPSAQLSDFDLVLGDLDEGDLAAILNKVDA